MDSLCRECAFSIWSRIFTFVGSSFLSWSIFSELALSLLLLHCRPIPHVKLEPFNAPCAHLHNPIFTNPADQGGQEVNFCWIIYSCRLPFHGCRSLWGFSLLLFTSQRGIFLTQIKSHPPLISFITKRETLWVALKDEVCVASVGTHTRPWVGTGKQNTDCVAGV